MIRRAATAFVLALALAAPALAELSVRGHVSVNAERVTLADVVEGAAPDLGSVFLVKAPALGKSRTLTGSFVAARLRQAGVDTPVRVPERVTIERASQTVNADRVQDAVAAYVKAQRGEDASVTCSLATGDVALPPGEVSIDVVWPDGAEATGHRSVPVILRAGGEQKKVYVDTQIQAPETVVVANNAIPRGKAVTEDDLRVETVPGRHLRGRTVHRPERAVGRVARRAIATGERLDEKALDEAPIVKRGDVVKLEVCASTITITAFAVAQKDGAAGDTVDVKNLDTGVIVKARVRDAHTVTVEL